MTRYPPLPPFPPAAPGEHPHRIGQRVITHVLVHGTATVDSADLEHGIVAARIALSAPEIHFRAADAITRCQVRMRAALRVRAEILACEQATDAIRNLTTHAPQPPVPPSSNGGQRVAVSTAPIPRTPSSGSALALPATSPSIRINF